MTVSRGSVRWLGLCGIWALSTLLGCGDANPGGKPAAPAAGSGLSSDPAATADAKPKPAVGMRRMILLTNGNSPFWDAAKAGMEDAKKDLKLEEAQLDAILEVNDASVAGQISKLRQFGSQSDVAGVAISAIAADNANVATELKNLKKKGIAVVTLDSDVDRKKFRDVRTAFIGTDNFLGGKELGICAKQLLPDGGDSVTFVGFASAQNAQDRIGGYIEGAGEKIKAVDSMTDDTDRTKARENVRNAIRNHPNLKVLAGIYSYNAPAIVDVVKELNKREALKVVAFDAEPLAVKEMSQGQIDAMIVQNPYQMGYQSVKLLKALITDDQATEKEMLPKLGEEDGDIFDTGLKVVVPNSESPIKKEGFGPKTEYLTLDEFKAWLEKYKLAGS